MKLYIKQITMIFILGLSAVNLFAKPNKNVMYIALDPAELKEKPSVFSAKTDSVNYGEQVLVIEEKKGWILVSPVENESVKGWVPVTALSKKKIVAMGGKMSADADEIALAGKGFTSAIEAVYANEYGIDYNAVNSVEAQNVTEPELIKFINDGKLFAGGSDDE